MCKSMKRKSKSLVGWIYEDEKFNWENIDAWGYIAGCHLCLLKNKKSLGKFKGKKIRITIEEL